MGRRWKDSVVLQDLNRIRTGDLYNVNLTGCPFGVYHAAAPNTSLDCMREILTRASFAVFMPKGMQN